MATSHKSGWRGGGGRFPMYMNLCIEVFFCKSAQKILVEKIELQPNARQMVDKKMHKTLILLSVVSENNRKQIGYKLRKNELVISK